MKGRRTLTSVAALWGVAGGLGLASALKSPPQADLESSLMLKRVMERTSDVPEEQVVLINTSSQGITAFALEYTGESGYPSFLTEDFAVSVGLVEEDPSQPHRAGTFLPGQSKRVLGGRSKGSVRVAAIVFEDRSAVGDPVRIASIFQGREAGQLVRYRWMQRLAKLQSLALSESELRLRLTHFKSRLLETSELYGNMRVSNTHRSALTTAKGISVDLGRVLDAQSEASLLARLQQVQNILEEDFTTIQDHVTHDVDGKRISLRRNR